MEFAKPAPLFNPVTAAPPLSATEIFAGPFGLLAFALLIPLVLLLGRRYRRTALILGGILWLVPTLQWATSVVLLVWLAIATAWVVLLGRLRRRGVLGQRVGTDEGGVGTLLPRRGASSSPLAVMSWSGRPERACLGRR